MDDIEIEDGWRWMDGDQWMEGNRRLNSLNNGWMNR